MGHDPRDPTRPPRLLRALARLLIRGRDASWIASDLDASFARDLERGRGRGPAVRRYAWNALASAWAVWTAALRRLVTNGIGLDAKLGLRMLARQPMVTVVAVLTLGLGIPASLTLLHVLDVLFSDLPVPEADRVVGVRHYDVDLQHARLSTVHDFERWKDLASLASIGAAQAYSVNVDVAETGGSPVPAARLTASSFDILGARPLVGRLLGPADEREGAPDVALIGEELWSARFARDPAILGRSIRIGSTDHTVVGVMPAGFAFPSYTQVWLPFRARALDLPIGTGPLVFVFGRLAGGVSLEDARVEMTRLTERRAADEPERFEHLLGEVVGMAVLLLNEDAEDGAFWGQTEIVILQTLIFGLLMVVCGNVGMLILARTAARSGEITIRTALGASRGRILTQLFVEAFVLMMAATGVGLLGANAFASWVMRLQAPYGLLPWWADLRLTPRLVAIALGLAALCAIVAGVLPALPLTRRALQANLQRAASRTASARFGLGASLLIVSQIALSVGFLAMGVTWVRSAFAHQGDLGFDPEGYVYATLAMPEPGPAGAPGASDSLARRRHLEEIQRTLLARLSEDPAVRGIGMGVHVPGLTPPNGSVLLETPPPGFEMPEWDVAVPKVDVSFFAGLGRPILAGRDFNAGDVEGPPGTRHTAVIVNESFVRDFLGGRNAVGQRLRYEPQGGSPASLDADEWYEIVGVVGSFGTNPENSARDAAVYHPLAPGEVDPVRYTVQVAGDPETFVPRFRRIAASLDPEAIVSDGGLVADTIRSESLLLRSIFLLVLALACAVVLLSATGLYAMMSFTVAQRTREIGIRAALGADARAIFAAMGRRAAIQVGVGLVLGAAWGWVLLDMERNDRGVEMGNIPLTLTLVAILAGCVCAVALARPTLRGLRIQPTEALRES